MPDVLSRLVTVDDGWLVESLALLLVPFLHEDVAIVGAAFLIVEYDFPAGLATLCLYAGMVASDLALYGIGAVARRNPWAERLVVRRRVAHLAQWLSEHLWPAMTVARVLPGLMFPMYVALGFCRVPFLAFAAITMVTAAVYLPIVLLLITQFGQEILVRLGYWSWIAALGLIAAAGWNWARGESWQVLIRSSVGRAAQASRAPGAVTAPSHAGMPSLASPSGGVALAERIPPMLFYVPLVAQWLWLGLRHGDIALPSLANPTIEVGGLWGESKSACLDMVDGPARRWLAGYATLRCGSGAGTSEDGARARAAMAEAGLSFPVVAKPDIGWRGFGVRLIADTAELDDYLAAYPEGEMVLLQRPVAWDGEAGILYARLPGEAAGAIVSLTLRYFPHVIGDGRTQLRELIVADPRARWKVGSHLGLDPRHRGAPADRLDRVPDAGEVVRLSFIGSNRVGGLYRNAAEHVTPALTRRIEEIACAIPEFHYGRFDVRFDSLDRLAAGEDFQIIEINGAGAEAIHVWDPEMGLAEVYAALFEQQRLLFEIGARNRARGFRSAGALRVLAAQWRQYRLIARYPASG